jgi:hypothetical protein
VIAGVIGFFTSRIGLYAIGALVATFVVGGIWKAGYNYRDAKCNIAVLQADIAALKRDLNAAKSAATDAEAKSKTLETETATQQKVIREYQDIIGKNPNASCRLTDDDLTRLRDIRSGRK